MLGQSDRCRRLHSTETAQSAEHEMDCTLRSVLSKHLLVSQRKFAVKNLLSAVLLEINSCSETHRSLKTHQIATKNLKKAPSR
jgi:hypothetical protein